LRERRRAELNRAIATLNPRIILVSLGLPDGAGRANIPAIRRALAALCANDPTLIVPYERDGHPDHEAAGEACLATAHELKLPIARYPVWAWHHRVPADFRASCFGCFALDSASQRAKADAIQCFRSQIAPCGARRPIVPSHVLAYFGREFEAFLL
jgi:LmbE family N-acetylglucosaminyl deacetylase